MNARKPQVLVVEDDPSIALGLRMNLEGAGYEVTTVSEGQGGLRRARDGDWDLLILDIMLPGLNGYELLCSLRADQNRVPVMMLSAKSTDVDKVMGLDLGADDYITKPFSVSELLARVRALLRRGQQASPPLQGASEARWTLGDTEVDPSTHRAWRAGEPVELTATEFAVLDALHQAKGRILSRRQIMDAVWGAEHHGTERTVDNFVAQLRAKLELDAAQPRHLLTVRGVGYRLDV